MAESVFRRVHRLRKTEERRARQQQRDADDHREACEAVVVELETGLVQSHQAAFEGSAALIAHHHQYALRSEVRRRGAEDALRQANAQVLQARTEVLNRAVEARTVELVAEAIELQGLQDQRHAEQKDMDEVGVQRFLRRAS